MALPENVGGTNNNITQGYIGPYKTGADSASGDVYVVMPHGANNDLEAYKSTDPDSGSFTAQDTTNEPVRGDFSDTCILDDGTEIHTAQHNGTEILHSRFNTSQAASNTDQWHDFGGGDYDESAVTVGFNPSNDIALIESRSDDDLVVMFTDMTGSMHSDTQIVEYAVWNGTSWTSGAAVLASHTAAEVPVAIVRGESDQIWLVYQKDSSSTSVFAKPLSSADSLGSEINGPTDVAGYSLHGVTGTYYDDAGTERVTFCYIESGGAPQDLKTWEIHEGVAQTAEVVNDTNNEPDLALGVGRVTSRATKAKEAYAVWNKTASTSLLYDKNDNSGGWGTDTSAGTLGTAGSAYSHANLYGREDNYKLAFVCLDNSQPEYYEVDLGAISAAGGLVARHPGMRQPLIRHELEI